MNKYILILPLLMLVFTACEDVIPVNVGNENVDLYYVEAKLSTKDKPFVYFSKALPVTSDQSYKGISNAKVTIADDALPANVVTLVEDSLKKGLYLVSEANNYYGITGHKYTVTIESQGVIIKGSDTLSAVSAIDSIHVATSNMGGPQFLSVYAFAQEAPGLGNYYKWDVYVNDTLLNEAMSMAVASDEFVDGKYVNDLEIFADFHDPKKPEDRKLKFMDTVYVKQNSLSKFANDYYSQMISQSQSGGLFSVLPANVKGNFTSSDGKLVMGMFSAQDVSISNSVIIDESIESTIEK